MRGQTLNLSFNVRLGQIKRADMAPDPFRGWLGQKGRDLCLARVMRMLRRRIHLMCHFPVRQGKPDRLEMQVEPRVCRVDRGNSVTPTIRSPVWLCL